MCLFTTIPTIWKVWYQMVRSCEDKKLDVILQRQKETSSFRQTQVLNN